MYFCEKYGTKMSLFIQDLSHNKLTKLPPGMGYLVRLVEFNLSHNQLQELPPDIVNLRGKDLILNTYFTINFIYYCRKER